MSRDEQDAYDHNVRSVTEHLFSLPTAAQLRNEIRAERRESDKQTRSRWLQEARSLPTVADKPKPARREWTVEQKARVLTEACQFDGEELAAYLERGGVKLAEHEQAHCP